MVHLLSAMEKQDHMAQQEFNEFLSEMNELIHSGIIRNKNDFRLWLEEVQEECQYCFEELSVYVEEYVRQNSEAFEWFV